MKITAVIPAYNEAPCIYGVIRTVMPYVENVIVVDDGSLDATSRVAKEARAKVLRNNGKKGYIGAIKTGFKEANGDIIVTLDGDGEHKPEEIPLLTRFILNGKADLVLGKRKKIARISERLISFLTKLKTGITDSGTGFRAMKKELALKLNLRGKCICGVSVLEAYHLGARITEVSVAVNNIDKERKTAWNHILQLFYVLKWIMKGKGEK